MTATGNEAVKLSQLKDAISGATVIEKLAENSDNYGKDVADLYSYFIVNVKFNECTQTVLIDPFVGSTTYSGCIPVLTTGSNATIVPYYYALYVIITGSYLELNGLSSVQEPVDYDMISFDLYGIKEI